MKNIKFAVRRMLIYPKEFVILLLQSTIAFVLIYISIGQIKEISSFITSTTSFKNHDEMFSIVNNINYDILEQRTESDNDSSAIMESYKKIKMSDTFKVFQHVEISTDLEKIKNDNRFINGVSLILINENNFEFNKYNLSSGKLFIDSQFNEQQDVIPIIMGNALKQYYTLDEEFEQYDIKFKVIGFLEQAEQSRGLANGFDSTITDFKAIVPIDPYLNKTMFDNKAIPEPMKARFIESLLTTSGIYDYQDSNTVYNYISNSLDETQLFDLDFKSTKDQISLIYNQQMQSIIGYFILSITIVIFSGIGIIMGLNSNILKSKKYYATHFLVGATQFDSYLTIIYQVLITLLSSLCLSLIITLYIVGNFDLSAFLLLMVFVLGYCLVITMSPIRTLRKMNLDSVIGGER